MIVSEAITLLQNAELKQLAVKDDFASILGYINLGILEIYKRFPLWEAEATVAMVDGTTLYKLDGIDANVTIDLSDHSLLLIQSILDEDDENVTINQASDEFTVKTPQFHQIKVSPGMDIQPLVVTYRAAPLFLTVETATIPLPVQFLEALFLYTAYKGHGSVKSSLDGENNVHYIRFDAACKRIKMEGLHLINDLSSTKFDDRGFV